MDATIVETGLQLRDYLPALYGHLLPGVFHRPVPPERRATCDNCAMCGDAAGAPPELKLRFFSPESKCCTFHPSLVNYLVGAILASTDPEMGEGRARIRAKIARGHAVTPRGVLAPRKYSLLYDHGQRVFGVAQSLRCPYYDHGACTVWRFREGVCSTYFCKYERGERGKEFWTALKGYLAGVELKLGLYAMGELVRDPDQAVRIWQSWDPSGGLTPEDLEEAPPPESERKSLWGEWRGREEEFFLRCHEKVSTLTREKFDALLGVDTTFPLRRLESSYATVTSHTVPRRLRKNPELCAVKHGDNYLCTSPGAPGDAFELSALVFPLLEAFDGAKDAELVCREIARVKKITLPPELLAKLYDLGVLIAA